MTHTTETQRTLLERAVYPGLRRWVDGFLVAKRAAPAAPRTVDFYGARLAALRAFAEKRNVATIEAVDDGLLRAFMLRPGGAPSRIGRWGRFIHT